jgi:hypothetical protein
MRIASSRKGTHLKILVRLDGNGPGHSTAGCGLDLSVTGHALARSAETRLQCDRHKASAGNDRLDTFHAY